MVVEILIIATCERIFEKSQTSYIDIESTPRNTAAAIALPLCQIQKLF
jgi:hypothetical protein